ncbi:MAG: hypothetical protein ACTSU4_03945 [Promethearchaeota archaeon]
MIQALIPKDVLEKILNNYVYVYVKNISREFGGVLKTILDDKIIVVEDKNNNLNYIPISEISVITERR